MNKKHKNTRKGFTLLEILLVIGAIGILAAIVLVAINPNRQLEAARNAKKRADINTIQKAIQQYSIDNNGQYPAGIDIGAKAICKGGTTGGCVDLSVLSPNYIASIPEPDSNYYYVRRSNNSIEVSHPRDTIWNIGGNPSLDLNFASNKSLIDSVSGDNLVTFTRAAIPGVVDTDGSEAGDLPTSGRGATYFDSDRVMRYSSPNTARFDHNPTTGESLGLLVEEQRTNLALNSATFQPTSVGTPAAYTVDQVAPDGTTTGSRQTAANPRTLVDYTGIANALYTFSFYCRVTSGTAAFQIQIKNAASDTVITSDTSPVATTAWRRFTVSGTTTGATTGARIELVGVVPGFVLWGAQLEAGAFPTSYIPTTTAAATRSADVASITGANFLSWYNQSEGTVFTHIFKTSSNIGGAYAMEGATAAQSIRLTPNNTTHFFRVNDTTEQVSFNVSAGSENARSAYGYAINNYAAVVNGGAVNTDTSAAVPSTIQLLIGKSLASAELNGHIRRLTYWPQRLSNANLQSITQ